MFPYCYGPPVHFVISLPDVGLAVTVLLHCSTFTSLYSEIVMNIYYIINNRFIMNVNKVFRSNYFAFNLWKLNNFILKAFEDNKLKNLSVQKCTIFKSGILRYLKNYSSENRKMSFYSTDLLRKIGGSLISFCSWSEKRHHQRRKLSQWRFYPL